MVRANPPHVFNGNPAKQCVSVWTGEQVKHPPVSGVRFAIRLAILARVFVSAMPTETGMPVHCFTVWRICRPYSVRSRRSKPTRLKKASSIE